ncbi:hypothetical protein AtubIFM57143_008518 [Aspergillus tubingensis]|nr:hypothetical protein AtubIFM57143_008518 [Aspergillus tubingensis]
MPLLVRLAASDPWFFSNTRLALCILTSGAHQHDQESQVSQSERSQPSTGIFSFVGTVEFLQNEVFQLLE